LESLGEIVNLQKDIERKDSRMVYIPFSSWEDTIALIDTCDFIVTCDTAIAHASSAMGKKTIVLMHAAAYFTWNHNEDMSKTQWYHDAWCIHQERPCIWDEAIVKCGNFIKENIMKGIY
jgi:ADP-heptose:LPS heptosyltransferase